MLVGREVYRDGRDFSHDCNAEASVETLDALCTVYVGCARQGLSEDVR